jgi:hypothetical protein
MSIAAALRVEFGAAPTVHPYRCSAEGCVAWTDGHYCAVHAETCASCGDQHERGTLVRGLCDGCRRAACAMDRADGYSASCGCGQHGAVR